MQFLTKRGFRISIFLREGERKKSAQCFIFHVHTVVVPNLSKGMVEYLVAPASSRITHPHPAFFIVLVLYTIVKAVKIHYWWSCVRCWLMVP